MESYINIDPNMIVNTTVGDVEVAWYDVRRAPFALYGFYEPLQTPYFRRLPEGVAEATSEGVAKLCRESAGGRVRFATDSPYIAIRAKFRVVGHSSHLTQLNSSGFDLYIDGEFGSRYVREFRMPYDMVDRYEQIIHLERGEMRSYTVNFPIHSVVESVEIGLAPDAALLEHALPYRPYLPIVIYGSSIVHGTAASRPGLAYPAILSRELNMDYVNMGFSGKALGEKAIAEWLGTLPMSVFVCDYDHNAPSAEHLAATHHEFYRTVRKHNSTVPYIMVTRPDYYTCPREYELNHDRRAAVMRSYLAARDEGDRNVYFVDGMDFQTAPHQYDLTVDSTHPNDAGFIRMADSIGTVIRHVLERGVQA